MNHEQVPPNPEDANFSDADTEFLNSIGARMTEQKATGGTADVSILGGRLNLDTADLPDPLDDITVAPDARAAMHARSVEARAGVGAVVDQLGALSLEKSMGMISRKLKTNRQETLQNNIDAFRNRDRGRGFKAAGPSSDELQA